MSVSYKVVLLGEGRVGKTCVCLRYTRGTFSDDQISTSSACHLEKKLHVARTTVHLNIWDTAGQERFHALGPIYYREAKGALLVYDITDKDSFGKVKNWVKELKRELGKSIVIVIVGNKMDLVRDRQVPQEEGDTYAESVGATHMTCSAKTGKGVEEAFFELTRKMLVLFPEVLERVTMIEPDPPASSSCCK
eukprot:TRINITY_DN13693_c0_g1_i4.p1 TRINITY_DN13693_c0_g1~~TRINITY_DN13693_c0_g1_i4.p1  ORF type:complete len:192 (+),score=10.17 TRINITY_DN13693_c0_g1_i4:121-696(+)